MGLIDKSKYDVDETCFNFKPHNAGIGLCCLWLSAFCTYYCRRCYCTSQCRSSVVLGDPDRDLLVGGGPEFFYQHFDPAERGAGFRPAVFYSVFCGIAGFQRSEFLAFDGFGFRADRRFIAGGCARTDVVRT